MTSATREVPLGSESTSTSIMQKTWLNMFERHIHMLREHLSLWDSFAKLQLSGTSTYDAAQICIRQTQEMLRSIEKSGISFEPAASIAVPEATESHGQVPAQDTRKSPPRRVMEDDSEQIRPSKRSRTSQEEHTPTVLSHLSPVKDVSALFTIDARPTPVEKFQASIAGKRAEKQLKRKLSQSGLHPIGLAEPISDATQPQKRPRSSLTSHGLDREVRPGKADEEVGQENGHGDGDGDEDSFIAKVQKKHADKESKRQKKLEKKRKRESNTSVEDQTNGQVKPGKKKQKLALHPKPPPPEQDKTGNKKAGSKPKKKKKEKKKSSSR